MAQVLCTSHHSHYGTRVPPLQSGDLIQLGSADAHHTHTAYWHPLDVVMQEGMG